jgi:Transglycosylase SLT domain
MAFFDQLNLSDPSTMALLGALAGVSQYAGASRLPQTIGQALGGGAAGLMAGQQQALANQQAQQKLTMGNAQIGQLLDQMRWMSQLTGGQPPSLNDLRSGNFQGLLSRIPNPGAATAPTVQNMLPSASAAAGLSTPSQPSAFPSQSLPQTFSLGPLTQAVHQLESGGRIEGVPDSPAGAIGPMQVLPSTAAGYGVGEAALRRPDVNLAVGSQYLSDLFGRYNDPEATAVAYNAGPGRADQWLAANREPSVLPKETQAYLSNFRKIYPQFAQAQGTTATDAQPATGAQPAAGFAGIDPTSLIAPMMLRNYLGFGGQPTPAMNSMLSAGMMPQGSPESNILISEALKAAGIPMQLGGERPGVPGRVFSGFDAQGRPQYGIGFQNPKTDTGQLMGPNGEISTAPGYVPSMAAIESARGFARLPSELYGKGIAMQPGGVTGVPGYAEALGGQRGTEAGAVTTAQNQANYGGLLSGLPNSAPNGAPPAPSGAPPASSATIAMPGLNPGEPVPFGVAANNTTARFYHPVQTDRGTLLPPLNQQGPLARRARPA